VAKFLVTGGAGFIGSNLVDALIASGERVRVLDDLSSGKLENLEASLSKIDFVEGDVSDPRVASRAVEGMDYVLHHAAVASVPKSVDDPWRNHEVNVDGTVRLLLAARRFGVKRFVLASSAAVYGESEESPKLETMEPAPISPYATSKLVGENYCRQFSASGWVSAVCLRYFNIFGPRQDPSSDYAAVIPIFVSRLLDGGRATIYGDGSQTRDFVYVDDIVHANLLAVERSSAVGRVFNIGGGRSLSVNDLYRRIARIVGSAAEPKYEARRAGDVRVSTASIERAKEGLGYSPRVDFDAGLARTVAWFREHRSVAGGSARR
jgi:nucleoside-diphosphate-sugar epimerase